MNAQSSCGTPGCSSPAPWVHWWWQSNGYPLTLCDAHYNQLRARGDYEAIFYSRLGGSEALAEQPAARTEEAFAAEHTPRSGSGRKPEIGAGTRAARSGIRLSG
ncbi:MAG TPA: hypothetical protein VFB38_16970 [Chthonomonadaceae bacterium]|nr:hypothetical protein [Chthonomonadaceae bacterium]